jgi:DNA-binding response OmpR family regulator
MNNENNRNFAELKAESEKFKVETDNEKKRILVIDDEETTLTMVRTMLDNNYEVVTIKSGKEALRLFFQGLVPDLVLLDLKMPDTDGMDTYNRIKAISDLHQVPIAIFTSSDDPKDKEQAQQMGAADSIEKPVEKTELLARVEKLL